jgi:hypothetical protein
MVSPFFSQSHDAVIHVYDETGNVIETHEHKGEFKERCSGLANVQPFCGYSLYGARNRLDDAI